MSELLNGRVFILLRAQRRLHWAQAIVAAARHPRLRRLGQNGDVLFRRVGEAASVLPVCLIVHVWNYPGRVGRLSLPVPERRNSLSVYVKKIS